MLPPAAYVAIRHAVAGDAAGACSDAEIARIAHAAVTTTLGTVGGRTVILASLQGTCICGNVNCPYLVLRLDPGGASNVLLDTSAYDVTPVGPARPLPDLRESAHDSALVHIETVDAYRDGAYAPVTSERVRGDTGERKPVSVPVRFAPGASSAPLHGRVSAGWDDTYTFAAAAGQRLTIGAVSGPAGLAFTLLPARGNGGPIVLVPGNAAVLPVGGAYQLVVDSDSDGPRAYRATMTIR